MKKTEKKELQNHAPDAMNLTIYLIEDSNTEIDLVGRDLEADVLTFRVTTEPKHGKLSGTPPVVTYTSDANYNGRDSFSYVVKDAHKESKVAVVTIGVGAVNDAPFLATIDSLNLTEDGSVGGAASASDLDGDTLHFSKTDGAKGLVSIDENSGAYVYSAKANENGEDSFTISVNDGAGGTDTKTVAVSIAAVNDAPVLEAIANLNLIEDGSAGGTASASDLDGDTLLFSKTDGAKGLVTIDENSGVYVYTAKLNANGADSFTISVNDGAGGTDTKTVAVSIVAVNDAPVLEAIANLNLTEDGSANGTASASDLDGDVLRYSKTDGAKGLVSIDEISGAYVYTAKLNENGEDSFTISVSDGAGGADTKTVAVSITAVNDAPVLRPIPSFVINENGSMRNKAYADDVDKGSLFYSATDGSLGDVVIDKYTGEFFYQTHPNVYGRDKFTISVSDGFLISNWTVEGVINSTDDPPAGVLYVVAPGEVVPGRAFPVNVNFTVTRDGGFGLLGAQFVLTFDPKKVRPVSPSRCDISKYPHAAICSIAYDGKIIAQGVTVPLGYINFEALVSSASVETVINLVKTFRMDSARFDLFIFDETARREGVSAGLVPEPTEAETDSVDGRVKILAPVPCKDVISFKAFYDSKRGACLECHDSGRFGFPYFPMKPMADAEVCSEFKKRSNLMAPFNSFFLLVTENRLQWYRHPVTIPFTVLERDLIYRWLDNER